MIQFEYVVVNDQKVKAGYKLHRGDVITIVRTERDEQFADQVTVIHETDSILVLSKPAGMLTHSKGAFNPEFTVADFIAPKVAFGTEDTNSRAGIVHRLDRQTSGVLIAAKTPESAEYLQRQFEQRQVRKVYVGVVDGVPKEDSYDITGAVGRSTSNPKRMTITESGKPAHTIMHVVHRDTDDRRSVVVFLPETGRTHQLRLHCSDIGFPLVGDSLYSGGSDGDTGRFLLHAYSLSLSTEPEASPQQFVADVPEDMALYIDEATRQAIHRHTQ